MFADRTQARCSNRRENESQRVRHRREFFDGRALQVIDERGLKSTVADAAMMLDHIDRSKLAHQLRKAIHQTLNENKVRTGDLGGTASTKEFVQALVDRFV